MSNTTGNKKVVPYAGVLEKDENCVVTNTVAKIPVVGSHDEVSTCIPAKSESAIKQKSSYKEL